MPVKVAHVRRGRFTNYVGRACAEFEPTCFGNQFHIGPDGNREEVIAKFAEWWYAPMQKTMRQYALDSFDDEAVLGCWCKPLACHADIIAGYVNWRKPEPLLW